MFPKLKDCLPNSIPVSQELLDRHKPDPDGSRRMLVDYKDMVFCLILNADCSVEILFVYSPLEKYDDRFYKAEDELFGKFTLCDEGGYILIESKKSGG